MLDWSRIDTVLLDMDGTLLDLYFDSRFWLHEMPTRYGHGRGMTRDEAWSVLEPRLKAVEGTLDWYCVEYWSRELDIDIVALKREFAHLIQFRDGARAFLQAVRAGGRRAVLVTNAHPASLEIKLERTTLGEHLDDRVTSHDLGHPKESSAFWPRLARRLDFEAERTLFVDDSLPVLRAARRYGIEHLLAVPHPDSQAPRKCTAEFAALERFEDITPG